MLTIIVFLCLCSQTFAANAITHVARADSGVTNFNPLFLSGGFFRDELSVVVRATEGTCYLVIDNQYTPAQDVDVWLSSDGEGGRDGGDVELYLWALPDSIAISAGSATTVTENFVYLTYNGGSPALKRHAAQDQIGDRGDFLDSMIFMANVGLGAVSGADEEVRYFNIDMPSLYKNPLRSTFHGHYPDYHEGIAPTIESKSFAATRGFLHSGPDLCLVPSVNTDDVSLYVPVYNDSNYARWDSLDGFAEYSSGEAIGVPHYFWVVIWGAISKDTTQYKLYMNIQAGTNTYLTRETAEQDKHNMLPTDIPTAFYTTGFLIAGIIINGDEVQALEDGSTYLDLRGFVSGTRGGGGAPPTDSVQIDAWNFGYQYNWLDSALANAGWGLETTADGDDSLRVKAADLDQRYFTEAETQAEIGDSLDEYPLTTDVGDSLSNYLIEAAVQAEIEDSLDEYYDTVKTVSRIQEEINDSLQTNWAAFIADDNDTVTAYRAAIHDSLDANWATFTAAGSGMPAEDFNDSLESQADFSPNIYNRIDTTTAKIPTATLADSTDGGAIRSETSREADSTDGGATRATTCKIADSTDGGAARATTSGTADALALLGWGLTTDNDSTVVDATDFDESADFISLLTDETGTGVMVFGTSPTFTTGVNLPANSVSDDEIDEGDSFEWTGVQDFTDATVTLPYGNNPTTNSVGDIAVDANNEAFEIWIDDESESALVPFYDDIHATIISPDGVNDTIILMKIDAFRYPFGIQIDQISITTRGDGAYTLTLAEYSSAWEWQATTDSLVQASGFYTEDSAPMNTILDADDYLTAFIPSTEIDQLHIHIIFHIKDGN